MKLTAKEIRRILIWVFLGASGCILLYWLLHETDRVQGFFAFLSRIFSPFGAGAALAFVLNVPMRGIERLLVKIKNTSLRRALAMLITFAAMILVLFAVFWLLIPQIGQTVQSLAAQLPAFLGRVQSDVMRLLNEHPDLLKLIRENTNLENLDWSSLIQRLAAMLGNSVATIVDHAFSAIGSITGAVVNAVLAIIFALYCLFSKETLAIQGKRLLYSFLPEKACDEIVRICRMTNTTFSNFISGQCLEACILGTMFAVCMAIFRMPYIPLVSVLVAVTALVPMVGAFVGCILGAFFILVDSPMQAVWFVVMFLVLQQIENNIIYPRVVGTSIGLPGMWVLLAVSVGGEIMGVVGMLLMIPLASVLYTLLREITQRRLEKRGIASEKLTNQPMQTVRPQWRKKRKEKKSAQQESNSQEQET